MISPLVTWSAHRVLRRDTVDFEDASEPRFLGAWFAGIPMGDVDLRAACFATGSFDDLCFGVAELLADRLALLVALPFLARANGLRVEADVLRNEALTGFGDQQRLRASLRTRAK